MKKKNLDEDTEKNDTIETPSTSYIGICRDKFSTITKYILGTLIIIFGLIMGLVIVLLGILDYLLALAIRGIIYGILLAIVILTIVTVLDIAGIIEVVSFV